MAIEKDLKRIADSLEILVGHFTNAQTKPPATQTAAPAATAATGQPPAPPAETTAPPAPPAETTALTPQQMNETLVAEFKRIGDRAPIDAAMKQLGVTSVANLTDAASQQQLIAAVKAIPGKAA